MKLESLKSSKFEAFKGKEIKNPLMVTGGKTCNTSYTTYDSSWHVTGHGTDLWEFDWDASSQLETHWGTRGDMQWYAQAPIVPEGGFLDVAQECLEGEY